MVKGMEEGTDAVTAPGINNNFKLKKSTGFKQQYIIIILLFKPGVFFVANQLKNDV